MIPKYHTVFYKNHPIHYLNGVYKVGDLPTPSFLTMTDAMKEIDKAEKGREDIFNLKQLKDKNGLSKKVS
jgi:hypothetical protein